MNEQASQFKSLIEASQKILITSHISPDPDATSSLLLVSQTLKANFPGKEIKLILEEEPLDLSFLEGYQEIEFKSLTEAVTDFVPNLFIIIDANNFNRVSRHNGDRLRELVQQAGTKSIIIDHHEPVGKDEVDLYINRGAAASAQEAYQLLFNDLALKNPTGYAQTTLVGLYADTGGFVYLRPNNQASVFDLAKELVGSGVSIEEIDNLLTRYTEADIHVLGELSNNINHQGNYSFSFLGDGFIDKWLKEGRNQAQLQRATSSFLDDYIRNIDNRKWGFIVYKNTLQGEGVYSVSFRAVGGTKDVSAVAMALGGGGHKPAAGAKFEATDVQLAISKVHQAINRTQ